MCRPLHVATLLAIELGRIVQQAVSSHPMFFAAALPARMILPLLNKPAWCRMMANARNCMNLT